MEFGRFFPRASSGFSTHCCCCIDQRLARRDLPLALAARGDGFRADGGEDGVAGDLVLALAAAGGGEAAVALDQAVGRDACEALEVVDVLRVVCLQAVLVLQGADEGVGRGVGFAGGEDVAGEGVECSKNERQLCEYMGVGSGWLRGWEGGAAY
jgi:hypothetical protein